MSWKPLEDKALKVREHILGLATQGGCFIGASLSAVDLVVYLYEKFLNIPSFTDPDRDIFLLSKGHDVPALYGMFVEKGWMPASRLQNHLSTNDSIYWHPNRAIPGVEFYSGSLGHLLSVGIGMALDAKWRKSPRKVVVVVGDGEMNEGSNWEGLLVAHAYKLDNLIVVVDRNEFQANIRTEELIPLEPFEDKFRAFGAMAMTVDGHDFEKMHRAFSALPYEKGRTSVVIAKTRRGKGLPSIEARADRWFCNFTTTEIESLRRELHGEALARIESETLVVR